MAEDIGTHCYHHLLEDGYTMARYECCGGEQSCRDCPISKTLRETLRREAKKDKIKLRTTVSYVHWPVDLHDEPLFVAVVAVRLDWEPDDETRDVIMRESGVHVCACGEPDLKLQLVHTPYCAYCGYSIKR